jgi:hypothetical protein
MKHFSVYFGIYAVYFLQPVKQGLKPEIELLFED